MNKVIYQTPAYILWEKTGKADGARLLRVYGNGCEVAIPDQLGGYPVTEVGPYCFSATSPKYKDHQQIYITQLLYIEETDNEASFADKNTQKDDIEAAFADKNTQEAGIKASFTNRYAQEEDKEAAFTSGYAQDQKSQFYRENLSPRQPLPETMADYPALAGKILKAVCLPGGVTTLHNAAFYNCRFLHTLSLPPGIIGIGSDEFTNCLRLNHILLRCRDHEKTGLALILERITTDLNIYFAPDGQNPHAAVFFPEYYEWLDEVSPAHLFTRSINGEGFRLRKAFLNHVIDYNKYDSCWENALKIEQESCLCHLAFLRLRYAGKIDDEARSDYLLYLKDHILAAMSPFIKEQDLEALNILCDLTSPDPGTLTQAIHLATEKEWSQGVACLMERNKPADSFAEKSFDFDFDDF